MQMDMKVGLGRWEKSLSSNALERLRVGSLRWEPTATGLYKVQYTSLRLPRVTVKRGSYRSAKSAKGLRSSIPSSVHEAATPKGFSVDIVGLSKNIKILSLNDVSKHASKHHFLLLKQHFLLLFIIIVVKMTRDIEIKVFDQSNVIFFNILKRKKRDVQKLIDELSASSSNYTLISMSSRNFVSHERL
jgi:hypothetical protein